MKNTFTLYFRAQGVYQAAYPFLSPRPKLCQLSLADCHSLNRSLASTLPPGNSSQHCSQRHHTSPLLRTSPRVGLIVTQNGPPGPVQSAPSSLCPSVLFLPSSLLPFQPPWPPGSPKLSKPQNLSICYSLCLKTPFPQKYGSLSLPLQGVAQMSPSQ